MRWPQQRCCCAVLFYCRLDADGSGRPGSGRRSTLPPWLDKTEILGAVTAAGGRILRHGGIDSVALVRRETPDDAKRLKHAGAWAVVATEVKNLASQTAEATETISAQIQAIQQESNQAVDTISVIVNTVAKVDETSAGIAAAIEEQVAATNEISNQVAMASERSNNASQGMSVLNDESTRSGEAARLMLSASEKLTGDTGRLRSGTDGFLSKIKA